ncbi:hypothetical protein BDW22DRAFT_524725 [Trametopsis cervina]|nr:hypothetical protein BDW22DRAFT_524725 [Trametopsis cervina]
MAFDYALPISRLARSSIFSLETPAVERETSRHNKRTHISTKHRLKTSPHVICLCPRSHETLSCTLYDPSSTIGYKIQGRSISMPSIRPHPPLLPSDTDMNIKRVLSFPHSPFLLPPPPFIILFLPLSLYLLVFTYRSRGLATCRGPYLSTAAATLSAFLPPPPPPTPIPPTPPPTPIPPTPPPTPIPPTPTLPPPPTPPSPTPPPTPTSLPPQPFPHTHAHTPQPLPHTPTPTHRLEYIAS